MVIIVTGAIGAGKTTVCEKVINILRSSGCSCGGILTYKAPDESLTILDIQTGEKKALASTDKIYHGPHTEKYSFNTEAINFGIRAIDKGAASGILIVDEVGYLELGGEGFVKSLELIRADKVRDSILVIRKELLSAFLAQLGDKPTIFETTISTRNQLPRKICSCLTGT
jgi:nucleoside-triphosphatase THEP1